MERPITTWRDAFFDLESELCDARNRRGLPP
jgi:hypothetical protein